MTYIAAWQEFVDRATELYCAQPAKTRYVWKYRPSDNLIVLKVTDDRSVLQYRTSLASEMKLIDAWNLVFLKMATRERPVPAQIQVEIEEEKKLEREAQAAEAAKKKGGGKQKK